MLKIKRYFLILALVAAFAASAFSQPGAAANPRYLGKKAADPATCSLSIPSWYFNTVSNVFKFCSATNTYTAFASGTTPSAASTTDILTGTNTAKFATADAIAALWEQGTNVASATTVSLGEGGYFHITGTVTITDVDFDTDKAGRAAIVVFDGILTLTHNSSTLILPGGANITTAAGDIAVLRSEGTDVVRVVGYQKASGLPTVLQTTITGNAGTATALAADPADCSANNFANAINASGTLTCAQPSISAGVSGLGTGVATALGTNVGSAGAPVLFNGAGGTPSSLTGTNISGTAASLTAGNVTTNANLTGDVTSVGNATTLASVVSAGGPTGSATVAPIITYDAKGRLTTVSSATITPAIGSVTGLGSGVGTFLATPSGANLASALTTALPVSKGGTNCTAATVTCFNNITGFSAAGTTGTTSTNLVFSTSPTFVTPTLGAATATSINGNTLTTGTYTLTGTAAKTLTFNNSLTLAGTDSTTMTFPSSSATISYTVASGTSALGTGAITSATCATVVTTSATGTATTDAITWGFNGDPTGVTGYAPATSGMLTIIAYPSAGNVNFKVCNNTTGSITPGAITLNWRIIR